MAPSATSRGSSSAEKGDSTPTCAPPSSIASTTRCAAPAAGRRSTRSPRRCRPPQTSPLEHAIGQEALGRYERALAQLGDVEREAVIARIELGFSYEEVAALVGKPSAGAARVAISRALDKLARLMSES